jgi:hypothetical protein
LFFFAVAQHDTRVASCSSNKAQRQSGLEVDVYSYVEVTVGKFRLSFFVECDRKVRYDRKISETFAFGAR